MAWPLRPLGATQIVLQPTALSFEQLAADTLGDHATEKDGFDDLFNGAALSLPADDAAISDLTPDLLDAGFQIGQFEAGNLLPLAKDTGDFTGAGDPLQQSVDNSATSTKPAAQSGSGTGDGKSTAEVFSKAGSFTRGKAPPVPPSAGN
jgi:hypothetical protein